MIEELVLLRLKKYYKKQKLKKIITFNTSNKIKKHLKKIYYE